MTGTVGERAPAGGCGPRRGTGPCDPASAWGSRHPCGRGRSTRWARPAGPPMPPATTWCSVTISAVPPPASEVTRVADHIGRWGAAAGSRCRGHASNAVSSPGAGQLISWTWWRMSKRGRRPRSIARIRRSADRRCRSRRTAWVRTPMPSRTAASSTRSVALVRSMTASGCASGAGGWSHRRHTLRTRFRGCLSLVCQTPAGVDTEPCDSGWPLSAAARSWSASAWCHPPLPAILKSRRTMCRPTFPAAPVTRMTLMSRS